MKVVQKIFLQKISVHIGLHSSK